MYIELKKKAPGVPPKVPDQPSGTPLPVLKPVGEPFSTTSKSKPFLQSTTARLKNVGDCANSPARPLRSHIFSHEERDTDHLIMLTRLSPRSGRTEGKHEYAHYPQDDIRAKMYTNTIHTPPLTLPIFSFALGRRTGSSIRKHDHFDETRRPITDKNPRQSCTTYRWTDVLSLITFH